MENGGKLEGGGNLTETVETRRGRRKSVEGGGNLRRAAESGEDGRKFVFLLDV